MAPVDPSMFPELPADLAALSDEDLTTLLDEFTAVARSVRERDEETLGERTAEQIVAELSAGKEAITAIKAEQTARADAEAEFGNAIDSLTADLDDGPEDEDEEPAEDEEDGDGDDTPAEEPEAVEEPVVAGARRVRRPLPRSGRRAPQTVEPQGAALLASTKVYPYAEPGERLDRRRVAEVMADVINKGRLQPRERIIVASATFDFPEERWLTHKDGTGNAAKIDRVNGPQALVASGGLCAPLTPIYSMPDIETSGRPVRDSLAGFRADRGGVIVPTNPVIGDYADAVGIVTAAEDEAGGTFAVKSCMRIECPEFNSVKVNSIYDCIEVGNLTGRAYPELLSRIDTLVAANHARTAETALLNTIRAGSTIVVGPNTTSTAGGWWKLLGHIHAAAAGMRSRNRMADNARLRVLLPEWIVDLLIVDANRGVFDRIMARNEIVTRLEKAAINVTFYKDGPSTNTAQVFAAQTAGNLLGFPSDTQWAMFPEGAWLYLDSGQLDLGIVRDSTLNSTNDYQVFREEWVNATLVGVESLWITSTLNDNGTLSVAKDFSASTGF